MSDSIALRAARIADDFFEEPVKSVRPIVGKGAVNQVAVVEMSSGKAVIRMTHSGGWEEYVKEHWCIVQAAAAGIPGPQVLSVGKLEDTSYIIETFVEGTNGDDADVPKAYIWRTLGEYARRIHTIRTEGYGEQLCDPDRGSFESPPHEGYDGTWHSYINYNINSLTEDDRLITLGVIDPAQSNKARCLFDKLRTVSFNFGLNHGDLSLKNTIVNRDGTVFLLDWGSAEVNAVPHGDIVTLLQSRLKSKRPDDNELHHFLDGYGMSRDDYAEMQHELNVMLLLRAFDKLRWAIDRSPDRVHDYAAYAKRVAHIVLK